MISTAWARPWWRLARCAGPKPSAISPDLVTIGSVDTHRGRAHGGGRDPRECLNSSGADGSTRRISPRGRYSGFTPCHPGIDSRSFDRWRFCHVLRQPWQASCGSRCVPSSMRITVQACGTRANPSEKPTDRTLKCFRHVFTAGDLYLAGAQTAAVGLGRRVAYTSGSSVSTASRAPGRQAVPINLRRALPCTGHLIDKPGSHRGTKARNEFTTSRFCRSSTPRPRSRNPS